MTPPGRVDGTIQMDSTPPAPAPTRPAAGRLVRPVGVGEAVGAGSPGAAGTSRRPHRGQERMNDHAYRVIQWASGGVGQAAMEGVLDHPELELVGCWVHSSRKDGMDIGTLIGRDPVGVTATSDIDALLASDADCVLYSPLLADPSVVTRILESGKNVVTPLGWFYPPPDERERFDSVCRSAGVTLHGTGIHPGGITERFPLVLSALAGAITHVRAEEFSDIRTYSAVDVIRDW